MKRTTLYCGALSACAVIALAVLFGCDDSAKKITIVTPKFLYAASCGSVPGNSRGRHQHALRRALKLDGSITGSISAFSVDATTGALTALAGNPAITGLDCPEFMAVDPTQKFLYVPDEASDLIHSYSIGASGTLTEVGTAVAQCAFQVAVDPSGKFLIAPDFCGTSIDVYSIGSDGSLTAVSGSPFPETSGNEPEGVAIDPTGKFAYVVDFFDGNGTVSAFSLSAAGALTEISGSPFQTGTAPFIIAMTPDGKFIYTNEESQNQIDGFSVNSTTGALTALSAPETSVGSCSISADATGTVLFSTDCAGGVYSSVIGSDGTLTAATGSPVTSGSEPWPITGDPSGKFVYAGDDTTTTQIFSYSYTSAGVLTPITGNPFAPAGTFTEGIVITH